MQNHRIRSQRRLRIESLEARRLLSASPSNTTQSDPEPFDGSPASIASDTDVTPPRIVSVRVSSQAWDSSYLDRIDPEHALVS